MLTPDVKKAIERLEAMFAGGGEALSLIRRLEAELSRQESILKDYREYVSNVVKNAGYLVDE